MIIFRKQLRRCENIKHSYFKLCIIVIDDFSIYYTVNHLHVMSIALSAKIPVKLIGKIIAINESGIGQYIFFFGF